MDRKSFLRKKDWIYWTPRILSILFICFIALFSLDVFEEGKSASEMALGLLMHNIPTFFLIIVLLLAWKHEMVGAIAYFLAGLLYIIRTLITAVMNEFHWYLLAWSVQIAGPAFFIAILFFLGWRRKRLVKK